MMEGRAVEESSLEDERGTAAMALRSDMTKTFVGASLCLGDRLSTLALNCKGIWCWCLLDE